MIQKESPLLQLREVSKKYRINPSVFMERMELVALNKINIDIKRNECLGIVGESGSGKSTLGRLMVGLQSPTQGEILFENKPLLKMKNQNHRSCRNKMQMIYQNPAQALNPMHTVRQTLSEVLIRVSRMNRKSAVKRMYELISLTGLEKAHLDRYPAQLSGGQKQRVSIARALAVEPEFLVADEPVSSLDQVYRNQIIDLLADLKRQLKLTLVIISHELHSVTRLADRVAVMYQGEIVEQGSKTAIMNEPTHPYARFLIAHYHAIKSGSFAKFGLNVNSETDAGW